MFGARRSRTEDPEAKPTALKAKLAEIAKILEEMGPEEAEPILPGKPVVSGPTDNTTVKFPNGSEVQVIIGTSKHIQVPGVVDKITQIVGDAYSAVGKRKYVDREDAMDRLEMGDAGVRANRVLHLAYKNGELCGCASSTFSPGWTPEGCGHWGLLAVDPAHQKCGIATAMVLAAERRLATQSEMIKIEYQYAGDDFSNQLLAWYEDRLGFDGGPRPRPGQHCFRHAFKEIPEDERRRGHRRRLVEIQQWLQQQLAQAEATASSADVSSSGGYAQGFS
eukprot:TRINITY_DN34595_c0_g1_i1.p1 TRINITY_DN34595_c0_g1~~TRINITY_DN34595_c0_g1_i1.p1  ORF type:complete len:278 (-),score=48.18 TRINITY_DN34595_c0_g1_i1:229-1062(-)